MVKLVAIETGVYSMNILALSVYKYVIQRRMEKISHYPVSFVSDAVKGALSLTSLSFKKGKPERFHKPPLEPLCFSISLPLPCFSLLPLYYSIAARY